jgi:o-succinylbenzoate synthase
VLPPLADLLSTARVVTVNLATPFRGVNHREAMLFEGPQGWAEFSPFLEYDDVESAAWLAAAIDFACVEPPTLLRSTVPVNATLPAVAPRDVAAILERFGSCRTVKVKVAERGQTLQDDVARVAEVRAILGAEGRIRVDANGGWNVDEAEHAAHALAPFDVEYLEQPCASVPELSELRERIAWMSIPVAADESVRKAADPLAVARAGAADILVIKAQPLGGIHAALAIVAAAGLPAVISSALETSIGISMGVHLAAALPQLEFDCGLATASLFSSDVTETPLVAVDGEIAVVRVSPTSAATTANTERTEWWHERITRCYALLESGQLAGLDSHTSRS